MALYELRIRAGQFSLSIDDKPFVVDPTIDHTFKFYMSDDPAKRLREAASELLRLKDGPRDDAYQTAKEPAWQALREALASSPMPVKPEDKPPFPCLERDKPTRHGPYGPEGEERKGE